MYYFPLIPRLQILYASNATAHDMRWHSEHEVEQGVMRHPSDLEFDEMSEDPLEDDSDTDN